MCCVMCLHYKTMDRISNKDANVGGEILGFFSTHNMHKFRPSFQNCTLPVVGTIRYLYLTGVDLEPAVVKLLHSVMVLRSVYILLVLFVLLVLISLCRRVQAVRTEALQQRSHCLGLGQLGDFEVLLVVWRVLSDQTLLLCGESRPLLLVTPLTIFPILVFVFLQTTDDGLLCKVHRGLEKRGPQRIFLESTRGTVFLLKKVLAR